MPKILTLGGMKKKKAPKERPDTPKSSDRHRTPPFQLRMDVRLRTQLEVLADRNASDVTEEIRIAIRKHLEANGLWPPPADN